MRRNDRRLFVTLEQFPSVSAIMAAYFIVSSSGCTLLYCFQQWMLLILLFPAVVVAYFSVSNSRGDLLYCFLHRWLHPSLFPRIGGSFPHCLRQCGFFPHYFRHWLFPLCFPRLNLNANFTARCNVRRQELMCF